MIAPQNFKDASIQGGFRKREHLFILCSHSSGSTALWRLLQTSPHVSAMPEEGQFIEGAEPILRSTPWNEKAEIPWSRVKAAWNKVWDLEKLILLEKSPPHILRAQAIEQNFENACFVVMVRNPYAYCEGTKRRGRVGLGYGQDATYSDIANGWVRESQYQIRNLNTLKRVMFLTYEALTDNPAEAISRLLAFMPGLEQLDQKERFFIHSLSGWVERPLTNLNSKQIAQLSAKDIDEINSVLSQHPALMAQFGYELLDNPYSPSTRLRLGLSTAFTKYITRTIQRVLRKSSGLHGGSHLQ